MKFNIKHNVFVGLTLFLMVGCGSEENPGGNEPQGFVEKEPKEVVYTNAQVAYIGDYVGEQTSDGWMVILTTDMAKDDLGNLTGEGRVLQILLSGYYNYKQEPNMQFAEGVYSPQINSSDYAAFTFVDGYMEQMEIPGGSIELPASTYYGYLAEGCTTMEVDLLDDGAVEVRSNGDGTYTIEGVLVGERCVKHRFVWSGAIEPTAYVWYEVPNSTIESNKSLSGTVKGALQDRGDYFGLKDKTCRVFSLFLGEGGVDLTANPPTGDGKLVRLDLMVPWDSNVTNGVPAGRYEVVVRNADTSIDRDALVPFCAIPGLPDCFNPPFWSGAWYVEYENGAWGEEYARIDGGEVTVEREGSGKHHITCTLYDCATPTHTVAVDVRVDSFEII